MTPHDLTSRSRKIKTCERVDVRAPSLIKGLRIRDAKKPCPRCRRCFLDTLSVGHRTSENTRPLLHRSLLEAGGAGVGWVRLTPD